MFIKISRYVKAFMHYIFSCFNAYVWWQYRWIIGFKYEVILNSNCEKTKPMVCTCANLLTVDKIISTCFDHFILVMPVKINLSMIYSHVLSRTSIHKQAHLTEISTAWIHLILCGLVMHFWVSIVLMMVCHLSYYLNQGGLSYVRPH